MTRRIVRPPATPKDFSSKVVLALTSRNTLKILNTIKPVTRAFTLIDITRLAVVILVPQVAELMLPAVIKFPEAATNHVTTGDKLEPVNDRLENNVADLRMRMPRL